MKILVLKGSPKQKSDTMRLTDAFLSGIKKTGEHEVEIVDIIKHNIKPCIGCFECWKHPTGRCVIDDYQNTLLDKMTEADCVIWSFPMYCFGIPSHVKAVMDRMLPLSKITRQGSESVNQDRVEGYSKRKKYVVICGCGFPGSIASFDALKSQCIHMFGRVRIIRVTETPLLGVPSADDITKPLLDKFVAAGEEFGKTGFICGDTLNGLEEPMMPNDEYLTLATALAEAASKRK